MNLASMSRPCVCSPNTPDTHTSKHTHTRIDDVCVRVCVVVCTVYLCTCVVAPLMQHDLAARNAVETISSAAVVKNCLL